MIYSIGQRVTDLEHQVFATSLKRPAQRLAAILLYAGMRYNQRTPQGYLYIDITHENLAAVVNLNRETVTRTLKAFERDELITLTRGRIVLLNLRELRQ